MRLRSNVFRRALAAGMDDDRSVVVVAVREAAADERQLIKRSSHDHVRAVKWSEVI